jgi:hypothetical protein
MTRTARTRRGRPLQPCLAKGAGRKTARPRPRRRVDRDRNAAACRGLEGRSAACRAVRRTQTGSSSAAGRLLHMEPSRNGGSSAPASSLLLPYARKKPRPKGFMDVLRCWLSSGVEFERGVREQLGSPVARLRWIMHIQQSRIAFNKVE